MDAAPNVGEYQTLDIAAASRKDEGALVLVDIHHDPEQARVSLQWVDDLGVAQGDRIELASLASTTVHSPTVATDGTRYVACWSQGDQVACSSISPGETKATAVYAAPGEAPVLVYGTDSWVLAYNIGSGPDATAQLQRLDANFQAKGAPARFSQAQGALRVGPALAVRATGFVLVTGAPVAIYTLDGELNVRGTPIELGVNQWSFVTVAATETTVAASVAAPYGSRLFQVDDRGTLKTTNLSGGGKVGLPIALRAQGSTIYGAWVDSRPQYEDLTSGSPVADPYATSSPLPIVTLQVRDSVLVAVAEYAGVRVQRVPATTR